MTKVDKRYISLYTYSITAEIKGLKKISYCPGEQADTINPCVSQSTAYPIAEPPFLLVFLLQTTASFLEPFRQYHNPKFCDIAIRPRQDL